MFVNALLQSVRLLHERCLLRQAPSAARHAAAVAAAPGGRCRCCCHHRAGWHQASQQHELLLHLAQLAARVCALLQLSLQHLVQRQGSRWDAHDASNAGCQPGAKVVVVVCVCGIYSGASVQSQATVTAKDLNIIAITVASLLLAFLVC
jgi:hypothetical protein